MISIGLIGLESSRPPRIVSALNGTGRLVSSAAAVRALVGGTPDQVAALRALDERRQIHAVVADPLELSGLVDAVIDCTRDGGLHLSNCEKLLAGGTHAFIDKPLATTAVDADRLVSASAAGGSVLHSSSGYRLAPELRGIRSFIAGRARRGLLVVEGPADPHSQYGGLFHYGIHHAEIASEILGLREPGLLTHVTRSGDSIDAHVHVEPMDVQLRFLDATHHAGSAFRVRATYGGPKAESVEWTLTLPSAYNEQLLERFVSACTLETERGDHRQTVTAVTLIERVCAALVAIS